MNVLRKWQSCVNQAWSFYLISDPENSSCDSLILHNVVLYKEDLENFVEPNFGLMEQLSSLHVLSQREAEEVTSHKTTTSRNMKILNYLLEKPWTCSVSFVIALMVNCQEHVVNYILRKTGTISVKCAMYMSWYILHS
jgi:hypothetical protein